MRRMRNLVLLAALPAWLGAASKPAAHSWTGDFGAQPWAASFHPQWGPSSPQRAQALADPELGAPALRVLYPAKAFGPRDSGVQWLTRFGAAGHPYPGKDSRLFLRYWLKFEPGFDFSKGGKLPGLAGNTRKENSPKSGGGGEPKDDGEGFSARIMWREEGRAFQYVYHPGQAGAYGDYFAWSEGGKAVRFEPGRWHCIENEVQLNSPGRADGRLRAWLDGTLVLEKGELVLRRGPELSVDCLYFETFFGGSEPDWAPQRDSYARFGPFSVSTQRLGCKLPGSPEAEPAAR